MDQNENRQPTPPDGATRAPSDYFTGVVWVKTLVPANEQTDCVVSDVTFEPGARNNRFGGPMAYPPEWANFSRHGGHGLLPGTGQSGPAFTGR